MREDGKVRECYDRWAAVYDRRYHHRVSGRCYYHHISRVILDAIPTAGDVLDLGCGTGLFLDSYLQGGGSGTGLDISRGMVQQARRVGRKGDHLVGNAESIPFRSSSFDAVTSLLAFSYVHDPDCLLAEAMRVLRPGGVIAICTLGRNIFTRGLPVIYSVGEAIRIRPVGVGAFEERYYTDEEIVALLSVAGFRDVSVQRLSFAHHGLSGPFYRAAKRIEPFVERNLPYLAYNICVLGRKPG